MNLPTSAAMAVSTSNAFKRIGVFRFRDNTIPHAETAFSMVKRLSQHVLFLCRSVRHLACTRPATIVLFFLGSILHVLYDYVSLHLARSEMVSSC